MSYLDTARKVKEDFRKGRQEQSDTVADPSEGRSIAVKICSHILDACIWLAFADDFQPDSDEPLAVYYSDEIPLLKNKTVNELREIHKIKLICGPRSMVRQ